MYCIYCGSKLDDDAKFCAACGSPVDCPESPPEPHQTNTYQNNIQQTNPHPNNIHQNEYYQTPAPKKSRLPMILGIIAGAGVVVLGGIFLLVFLFTGKKDSDTVAEQSTEIDAAKDQQASENDPNAAIKASYTDYLKDILIPTYGMFNDYRNITLDYDYYGYPMDWSDDEGILGVDIDDYDNDGTPEMLVIKTAVKQYLFYDDSSEEMNDGNQLMFNMYEYADGKVVLSSEVPLTYHTFYEEVKTNHYVFNTAGLTGEYLDLSMIPKDDGSIILCEFSEWGIVSDGVYHSLSAIKYDGNTMQQVAEVSQEGAGSSEITFANYEFSDGKMTGHSTFFEEEADDISVYADGITKYFASHDIAINKVSSNLYDYSNSHKSILEIDNRKPLVKYIISKDEKKSTSSVPALKADLEDSTSFHSEYYPSAFSGDPNTYVTCNDYQDPVATNGTDAYYISYEDDYNCSLYKQPFPLKADDQREVISSSLPADEEATLKLAGVYDNKVYFYQLFWGTSGPFYSFDLGSKNIAKITDDAMLPAGFQDKYAYFTKESDDFSAYHVYNIETNDMTKFTDYLVSQALYAANGKIYYAETTQEYADMIGEYDNIDIYEDNGFIRISIIEANADGSDKRVLVDNLDVKEIMQLTDHCIIYQDTNNKQAVKEF